MKQVAIAAAVGVVLILGLVAVIVPHINAHFAAQEKARAELLALCLADSTVTDYQCHADATARQQRDALNTAAAVGAAGLVLNGGK